MNGQAILKKATAHSLKVAGRSAFRLKPASAKDASSSKEDRGAALVRKTFTIPFRAFLKNDKTGLGRFKQGKAKNAFPPDRKESPSLPERAFEFKLL